MLILIKPFLYLLAFAQTAVLFAGVIGLACLLLMRCVRAIASSLPNNEQSPKVRFHTDEMRAVVESEWPELAYKLPPKRPRR
jgi:hypothetical protein